MSLEAQGAEAQDIPEPVEQNGPAAPEGAASDEPNGEAEEAAGSSGDDAGTEEYLLGEADLDLPIVLSGPNGEPIKFTPRDVLSKWDWMNAKDTKELHDLHLKKSQEFAGKEKTWTTEKQQVISERDEAVGKLQQFAQAVNANPAGLAVEVMERAIQQGHDPMQAIGQVLQLAVRNGVYHPNALAIFQNFVGALQEGAGYDPRVFQAQHARFQADTTAQQLGQLKEQIQTQQNIDTFQMGIGKVLNQAERQAVGLEMQQLQRERFPGDVHAYMQEAWKRVQAKSGPKSAPSVATTSFQKKLKNLRRAGEAGAPAGGSQRTGKTLEASAQSLLDSVKAAHGKR